MSTDWDVESYRSEFESDEHWELRKTFMLAHKERIPEDEIVCLAQVFTNIEFLGCRYPEETMKRVAQLAKGIVESYRERKKKCLKRTFVDASDAASAKVKGSKGLHTCNEENEAENVKKMKVDSHYMNKKSDSFDKYNQTTHNKSHLIKREPPCNLKSFDYNVKIKKLKGPFSDFVLFLHDQEHPVSLLMRNAGMNKCCISWKYDLNKTCFVYLNNELVGVGEGSSKKACKELAAKEALQKLQGLCYTIRIKAAFVSDNTVSPATLEDSATEHIKVKFDIGEQIMKLMGWGGGGLGVKQQGTVEPVCLLSNSGRSGLGLKNDTIPDNAFRIRARDYIKEWMNSNTDQDLVFTSDFTSEQRKILHEIAQRFSLKSKSYGKGDERHLVVSRKPSPWQIVEGLARVGGSTSKYELIIPGCSTK